MKTSIAITAALLIVAVILAPGPTIAVLGILILAGMALAGREP